MMGGSDPENLTIRVMKALALTGSEDLEVTVIAGGSNPHFESVKARAAQCTTRTTVRRDVSNIGEFMAAADVAVSAAGSTCWELCLLGLPALLIDVAPNQAEVAKELDRRGCAVHVGNQAVPAEKIAEQMDRVLRSRELRQSLSQSARALVDANGARRVVSILRGTARLWLRRVR
jgi:spore coat polysaccharide biosynthesis predicted glycosyltransferase SpsG